MTLILTALCKNGICVCADKRNRIYTNHISYTDHDNLDKIHKFRDTPLIIFNHGLNQFGSKSWKDFCVSFENSNQWKGKSLKSISESFKSFIVDNMVRQLESNIKNMPNTREISKSGFALCGKDLTSNNYEFHELHWSPEFTYTFWTDTRLICTGEWERYLGRFLVVNSSSNSVEYWGRMNRQTARKRLEKLFSIAIVEQRRLGGKDFSDTFNIRCISD